MIFVWPEYSFHYLVITTFFVLDDNDNGCENYDDNDNDVKVMGTTNKMICVSDVE